MNRSVVTARIFAFVKNLNPFTKKLFLFFAAAAGIVLFFFIPQNKEWLKGRIVGYYGQFPQEIHNMGIEHRMAYRFEGSYTYSKQIADFFNPRKNKNTALVLVPPTAYFEQQGIAYHVPEPAVFYYYTGLKTLWANSTNAASANWYAHVKDGKIVIDSVTNSTSLKDTLTTFKKFNISL